MKQDDKFKKVGTVFQNTIIKPIKKEGKYYLLDSNYYILIEKAKLYEASENNRYQNYTDYLTSYQDNIDIVASCKDPKQALKIDMNYIMMFLKQVKNEYDIILVDTTHGFTKENINILDKSDIILYMMTNDIMDIKNTKSYMEVMNDIEMDHIKIILNNSRDINLNYFSKYDIRSMIVRNIDYSLDRSLYIKNITSFLIEGEIFTLNKSLTFKDKNDLKKLENMARDFIEM